MKICDTVQGNDNDQSDTVMIVPPENTTLLNIGVYEKQDMKVNESYC